MEGKRDTEHNEVERQQNQGDTQPLFPYKSLLSFPHTSPDPNTNTHPEIGP